MKNPEDIKCANCGNADEFVVEYESHVIHLKYETRVEGFIEVESMGTPKYKCKTCGTELSDEDAKTILAHWYQDPDS